MKFKNQVNLVYDGRTQQKGRAANDDQEGAQESSLGGEGMGVCGNALYLILGAYTHAHMGQQASSSTLKGVCILLFVN